MKGKFKFVYLSIICLAVLAACSCCFVSIFSRRNEIAKAVGTATNEFTFVDKNSNVIVSIEKVAVQAKSILNTGKDINKNFTTPLYDNYISAEDNIPTKKMLVRNDAETESAIYYKDIPNGTKNPYKYVVNAYNNQEFVMLNNRLRLGDEQNYYYNPELERAKVVSGEDISSVELAEAVMISVGQYFYVGSGEGEHVELSGQNEDNLSANIQYIGIEAYKNGKLLGDKDIPGVREFNNNVFEDFVWIIPQQEGNEGYYDIYITYKVNGQISQENFSFYLLFASNYNQNAVDEFSNTYSSFPTLTNVLEDGTFNLGKDDLQGNYPTITYDYTKFKMSYTHTANGVTNNYDYSYSSDDKKVNFNCNKNGSLYKSVEMGEIKTFGSNIAVVVLTDLGEYDVSFEYIYTGFNSGNAPKMNLTIANKQFVIHGFDLKYALAGHNGASMRYLKFATPQVNNENLSVGLIVPNGYERQETVDEFNLGVVYEFENVFSGEEKVPAVGSIIERKNANFDFGEKVKQPSSFVDEVNSGRLSFVKTNQGGLWFDSIDRSNETGSFYYYSANLNSLLTQTYAEGTAGDDIPLTNVTTFNKTGYYMVFVEIQPYGTTSGNTSKNYYSAFAFQYSAETPDVKINEREIGSEQLGKEIGSGGYTNKEVVVSWQLPDVFERKIVVNCYKSPNGNYLKRQDLINLKPTVLTNNSGSVLGSLDDVPLNSGASYLIETKSEGKSATYRTFIVDRESIKGVTAYAVESSLNRQGNVFYRFLKDNNGNNVKLANSITNTNATLWWNDKSSGAEVKAYYTFTPFVKNNLISVGEVEGNTAWHQTNYSLGSTIGNFDLMRASSISADLETSSILFSSGIYLFTIIDEAGNSCKYMFVIDRSESYFKVKYSEDGVQNYEYLTRTSKLYTDSVEVEVGSHKVIKLERNAQTNNKNEELFNYINAAVNHNEKDFNNLNYYKEGDSNRYLLNQIFGKAKGSNELYLTVANNRLTVYNDQQTQIDERQINNQATSYTILAAGSSVIRTLCLVGINQLDILNETVLPSSSNSYLTIEVNSDHSQGMAYFGNNLEILNNFANLTPFGQNGASRLVYGDDGQKTAIYAAHATADNYLVFSWYMGYNTKYEVENISYKYYDLNLIKSEDDSRFVLPLNDKSKWFNEDGSLLDNIFYYSALASGSTTIYSKNSLNNNLTLEEQTNRAVATINLERNQTKAGLYIITRTYGSGFDADASEERDSKIQYYYFIVDRNRIIELGEEDINGGYISIGLKDNESQYNNFYVSDSGSQPNGIYLDGNLVNYNICLETNRLPAILNIPVGKYFYYNDTFTYNGSFQNGTAYFGTEYYAGNLNFDVYFKDVYNQLSNQSGNVVDNYKLFSSNKDITNNQTGFYELNFSKMDATIRNKFFPLDENENNRDILNNYIWLEGDYIIVIKDNIENTAHQQLIAFRIKHSAPSTDVFSMFNTPNENSSKQDSIFVANEETKTLTTSEEFVVVELNNQEVISSHINAKLDVNYLLVNKNFDGQNSVYINYNHGNRGGIDIDAIGKNVLQIEQNGNEIVGRKILLDTMLRDDSGNIIKENLTKTLEYTITVRYDIVGNYNKAELEQYKDCYYYYDYSENPQGEMVWYCESSYKVIIDRVAPQNNISNLLANDQLLTDEQKLTLFENTYIERADGIYFVNRLKNYYDNVKNRANIYAFYVNNGTKFDNSDVYSVQFRNLDATTAELVLPLSPRIGYTPLTSVPTSYRQMLEETGEGFYEIVEQDNAGNTSQYVVFYDPNLQANQINMMFEATYRNAQENNGNPIEGEISLNFASNGNYTIFQLKQAAGIQAQTADRFFNIEITKGQGQDIYTIENIFTNLTFNFDNSDNKLANQILNALVSNGYDYYGIKIKSHLGEVNYVLEYLEKTDIQITLSSLVVRENGDCYLDLSQAKTQDGGYFAKYITLRGQNDDGSVVEETYYWNRADRNYYYDNQFIRRVENNLVATLNGKKLNGAYVIIANVAENLFYYHFNTDETLTDNAISFGENGTSAYTLLNNVYYSFNQANLRYNSMAYSLNLNYSILCNGRLQTGNGNSLVNGPITYNGKNIIELTVDNGVSMLKVLPYFANDFKTGAVINVEIVLVFSDGTPENPINIVLDTDTGLVSLNDKNGSSSGNEFNVDVLKQTDDIYKTSYPETLSGQMWLNWTVNRKDYFIYTYTLFETLQNGEQRIEQFDTQSTRMIDTGRDSKGEYRFVVDIFNLNGEFLGRKVYTFSVQSQTNQLYTVTSNNLVLEQNSTFKMVPDVFGLSQSGYVNTYEYLNQLGVPIGDLTKISIDLPLYVYNKEMSVQTAQELEVELYSWQVFNYSNAKFTIYRISSANASTYNLYIGLLYVVPTEQVVNNLAVETLINDVRSTQNISPATSLEYSFTGNNAVFTLTGEQIAESQYVNSITLKNSVVLSVWFRTANNEKKIHDIEIPCSYVNNKISFNYELKGSGQFVFEFKDLAGNVHNFNFEKAIQDSEDAITELDIIVLKEVVLLANGMNAIDNAYYNGEVEIQIFSPNMYDMRGITLNATLNGNSYTPTNRQFRYIFKEVGTYRLTASAYVNEQLLTKTLAFTIVNENEAKQSFDLTNLFNYTINSIKNSRGQDITKPLIDILNANSGRNKYLLTYNLLVENAEILGIVSGKQQLTIEYMVADGIYPNRVVEFSFAMSNEQPNIQCNVKSGDSTTKSFTITFNPGIIYEQIGDCAIYINDEIVCEINANSTNSVQTHTVSYKKNGAGDYYIVLRGPSGTVHYSCKVVIKEPLNGWSIFLIVVVVLVVGTVIGVIIFLRHKMKIR